MSDTNEIDFRFHTDYVLLKVLQSLSLDKCVTLT